MDRTGQAVFYGWVVYAVVAEGDVPNDGIKIVVGEGCFFKSLRKDGGVGVQFLGDPGRESVQFNPCPISPTHALGHKTEEMPDSHSRLQHLYTFPYAEALHSIPDCLNNQR